ncbi:MULTISPECIES: FAD-binding oxidoreductase [Methylomonas]|uniref:FAD-binding PCMH-type domain-containing protein n=1 Tax=Methylomonas koyamae TaxID=702114 RepID=A0A177PEF2_9GAMM|nr:MULTISPECIES: FAD-binding oxidoreductase [Methylomonas]MDT4329666.1 FAD-binding oxidoreductase [Methylomonas sp. MV1]OAI28214.1 hypothetical protein A1355_17660 [Methylomonas koyamae]
MEPDTFAIALTRFQQAIGADRVNADSDMLDIVTSDCSMLRRRIIATLELSSASDVCEVVRIANEHRISLYPFSTGRNWGYGSKNPVQDCSVLVDLSHMTQIIDFDDETGLVTIEPGVTQRQLDAFLRAHGHPYIVPVTGGGPDCSLVGNALERGYGITPYADHFSAVMSLEAVLPNGEIYRSMMEGLGGVEIDKAFKYGMGPYCDGLFSQGNFGIVTKMTIALAPKPERVEAFFFGVKKSDDLELAVEKVRQVLREVGAVTGSINLMNGHRMLSMSEPYPKDRLGENGMIPDAVLKKLMRRNLFMEWTGVGAIYGNKKVVKAVKGEICKILGPVAKRLVFFTPKKARFLFKLASAIPIFRDSQIVKGLASVNKSMQIFAGEPSEIALPLAYWRSGVMPADGTPMNPDVDGCGLIWYSPLLPMKPSLTRAYVDMVTKICVKHKIEPLITLTSISDRCWDSTIPILFDRQNSEEVARAHACYHELLDTGIALGFIPYRLGIQSMSLPSEKNAVPSFLQVVKKAVDPSNIMAPGRYGL